MATNEKPVLGQNFDLANLYQQLKEIESLDRQTGELIDKNDSQRFDISSRHLCGTETSESSSQPSLEAWNEHHKMLVDLRELLETSRSRLRATANIVSRPGIRPLRILDLPDELLMKIFRYVKGDETFERYCWPMAGVVDIKNLRLTCRRFSEASSHLLIHFVSVELHPFSLARLGEISRHPIISKGVRTIRVSLHFYGSSLAADINSFSDYQYEKLRTLVESLEQMASWHDENSVVSKDQTLKIREARKRLRARLEYWERFRLDSSQEPDSKEESSFRKLLHRAFVEYHRRYEDQENLLKGETFVPSIVTAFVKMPTVARLEIEDGDGTIWTRTPYFVAQATDDEAFIKANTVPLTWNEAMQQSLGRPPAEFLALLPVAIGKAGLFLTRLQINVAFPKASTLLTLSEEDQKYLTSAIQRLQDINFRIRSEIVGSPEHTIDARVQLTKLLAALLDTDSLQRLSLDVDYLWDGRQLPPSISLGPVINQRRWPHLNSISLTAVPLHLKELERFFDRPGCSLSCSTIVRMHLLSGMWAEGLDILRKKPMYYNELEDTSGAECEELSAEERKTIFGKDYESRGNVESQAEAYILGWTKTNPLRDREIIETE